ncbi:MAG: S8 family serine peptidase, partial [Alphaproteobacteria bacterium]|nr:S8 family serine peptidase [Alphaproteobacteria bacterium]
MESPEFQNTWHLKRINAHKAYARGATGEGEIVGIIDASIHLENYEFAGDGKIVAANPVTTLGNKDPRFRTQYFETHGTQVASVAVGARGGASIPNREVQGVAYNSKLAFWEYSNSIPIEAASIKFFNGHGAAIVNVSLSNDRSIDDYTKNEARKEWSAELAALTQTGIDDADKIIFVLGTGNDRHASPALPGGLGVHFPELRGHVLAVTGVNELGEQVYNKCGKAKAFCLAAPAKNIWTGSMQRKEQKNDPTRKKPTRKQCRRPPRPSTCINPDFFFTSDEVKSSVEEKSGTSFATPQVSGALALMRQFFSDEAGGTRSYQLGNTELVARLLHTANRTGEYADSDKFGHGLLDLDAATKPYGMLMDSLSTDPNARPFDASAFAVSGNAFGGAM